MDDTTSFTTAYPAPSSHDGSPRPRRAWRIAGAAVAGIALTAGLVGAGLAGLHAFNPVADEWQCSQGEAPAGNSCYPVGSDLPRGVRWHPLGNRPMSYNCDKDGWVRIATGPEASGQEDCMREGTALPRGWRVVAD